MRCCDLEDAIVISGVGVVTASGAGLDATVDACLIGNSAISPLMDPVITRGETMLAARCGDLNLDNRLRRPKQQKFMNRPVRAAVFAALEALNSSGILLSETDPERVGVYCGSGATGLDFQEFLPAAAAAWNDGRDVDPAHLGGRPSRAIDRFFSLRSLSNAATGLISAELDARGPGANYAQSETASAMALQTACFDILEGRCDVAIAGGYDSLLQHSIISSLLELNLLAKANGGSRCGLAPGEGAAFTVLETARRVRARNGPVRGEICGFGMATKASWHVTDPVPDPEAVATAIQGALGDHKCDFVVRRRTGVCAHDSCEDEELRAFAGSGMVTTAFKHITGYLGAASAAAELVLGLACAAKGRLPAIGSTPPAASALELPATARQGVFLSSNWTGQVMAIAARAPAAGERG